MLVDHELVFSSGNECPFVLCNEDREHTHPICPECGALRYGNAWHCDTCSKERERFIAIGNFAVISSIEGVKK